MRTERWRVAVTRDDKGDTSLSAALERAGFIAVSVPVLAEGPAPDPGRLATIARQLESFDWIVCASVRGVRAIRVARGSEWPSQPRTAAVGPVTAAAIRDAGGSDPIVGSIFTAKSLWERLKTLNDWRAQRVLVMTVDDGTRDLIDGLRSTEARVTELQPYSMIKRPEAQIRADWFSGRPDAVILGSAKTAIHLINAVGLDEIRNLKAVVPIGPTTSAGLDNLGIRAEPPPQATFASAVEKLRSLLPP
jgi:uroporphyrinogen-III synthase